MVGRNHEVHFISRQWFLNCGLWTPIGLQRFHIECFFVVFFSYLETEKSHMNKRKGNLKIQLKNTVSLIYTEKHVKTESVDTWKNFHFRQVSVCLFRYNFMVFLLLRSSIFLFKAVFSFSQVLLYIFIRLEVSCIQFSKEIQSKALGGTGFSGPGYAMPEACTRYKYFLKKCNYDMWF